MTIYHNGHSVTFNAGGRIDVDGKRISLAINQTNGGHYTYIAHDRFAGAADGFGALEGRKLTGPGKRVGSYEQQLAEDIIAAMFN